LAARCRSRLSSLALRSIRSALLPAANRSLSLAPLVARFARTALLGCGPVFIPGAIAVIPARAGSRRLPEKPLVSIGGVPLVVRVLDRVRAAGLFERVVVATDDARIAGLVEAASGEVVMVTEPCASGTERVARAVAQLAVAPRYVVNVQGDEPFVAAESLAALLDVLVAGAAIATLSAPLDPEKLHDFSSVKVVCDARGRALYFSRAAIPGRLHLGLYGFTAEALAAVAFLPRGPLALAEDLEQLAWLEAGWPIAVTPGQAGGPSIDTPADLAAAELYLRSKAP
jgi:3-deoxy-manno-octulosonate cytidylyltransferase (CMP-KDO synthetase)